MALRSQLLRGDAKLEAAAVSDAAHITQGARGEHVRKIQQALIQIDDAGIDADGAYGPATAAAVLAYKRKRNIVNRSYQTQADDIVGKMTVASLDGELLRQEEPVKKPARIVPVHPIGRLERLGPAYAPARGGPMLGFKIAEPMDARLLPHLLPNGSGVTIELRENELGTFQVLFGKGGTLRCADPAVGIVSDPAMPNAHGGTMRVTKDAHLFNVRGRHAGTTRIEFWDGTTPPVFGATESLTLKVTDPRAGGPWVAPDGTPLKPKGTGRKINLFGQGETAGFEDYSSDERHRTYQASGGKLITRPWTKDPSRPPGIPDKQASDICIRSTPIRNGHNDIIPEIGRIAMSKCRVTYAGPGPKFGAKALAETDGNIEELRQAFPDAIVIEESVVGDGAFKAIVLELP
jgi:peptidoglycan hydrolase-like protein with peptidoglycan-binding domain